MKKASQKERNRALVISLVILFFFSGIFLLESVMHYNVGRLFDPCGFKQRYHLPCITCGFTTAVRAFARGSIIEAFIIQPAAALISCFMVIYSGVCFFIALTGNVPDFAVRYRALKRIYIISAWTVILLSAWAVTMIRALAARG